MDSNSNSDDNYDYLSALKSGFNSDRYLKKSFIRRTASTETTSDSDSDDCIIIEKDTKVSKSEDKNKNSLLVATNEDKILVAKQSLPSNTNIKTNDSSDQKSESFTKELNIDLKSETKPLIAVKNESLDKKPDIKPDIKTDIKPDIKPFVLKSENGVKSEEKDGKVCENSSESIPEFELSSNEPSNEGTDSEDSNNSNESNFESNELISNQKCNSKGNSDEIISAIERVRSQHQKPTFERILVQFKKLNPSSTPSDPISTFKSLLDFAINEGIVMEIVGSDGISYRQNSDRNQRKNLNRSRKSSESSELSFKKLRLSEDKDKAVPKDVQFCFQSDIPEQLESLATEEYADINDIDVSSAKSLFEDTELSPKYFELFRVPTNKTPPSLSFNSTPIKSFNHTRNKEVIRRQSIPTSEKSAEEIDESLSLIDYRNWLLEPLPRYSPFIGQKGDRVVYLRDAHQIHIDAEVKYLRKLYQKFHSTPEEINSAINCDDYIINAIISDIKFYQVNSIKFSIIQLKNLSNEHSFEFKVLYRPNRGICEFLVLEYIYKMSQTIDWKIGEQFRSLWKKSWWIATIVNKSIFNPKYPESLFKRFEIKWNTGEEGRLSPWDLFVVDKNRLPKRKENGVLITNKDLIEINYRPNFDEWPEYYGEMPVKWRCKECQRIYLSFKYLEKNVCPNIISKFKEYNHSNIAYPVNLQLIKQRLKNMFYRRKMSVIRDITYLKTNAKLYVKKSDYKKCEDFVDLLLDVVNDTNSREDQQISAHLNSDKYRYLSIKNISKNQINTQNNNSLTPSSHSSIQSSKLSLASNSTKPKSSTKKRVRKPSDMTSNLSTYCETNDSKVTKSTQWKEDSQKIIGQLFKNDDSLPYRQPVDPIQFPYYSKVISNPIDLSEIQSKLNSNQYLNPIFLRKDFRLMFENAKAFTNDPKSKMRLITKKLLNWSEDKLREIIVDWERVHTYEQKQRRGVKVREPTSRNQLWGYKDQQYY